jgi:hypothetical protein
MIPPMVLNLPNRFVTAAAVAATTIEVMMTILISLVEPHTCKIVMDSLRRMAEREECSYGDWLLATCK